MKDRELIDNFLNGDMNAFHALMSRYQRQVFYAVKAVVFDTEDAKDITQQAFVKAFQKIGRLRKKERFRSWIMTVAMNCARDHLRKKKDECELFENVHDSGQSVEGIAMSREMVRKVKEAVSKLPHRQRMVLGLRLFREMDFEEISEIMEIKAVTARASFHFGMRNLLKRLKQEGIRHGD
jgi:RNA polymerase sigma-70 factor (ECF subfamily)